VTDGYGKYSVHPGSGTGSARAFGGGGNGGLGFARLMSPGNSSVALALVTLGIVCIALFHVWEFPAQL
jgi:hypothetical protein